MPNYTINSVYQPFSFQERLAPLQIMKEEYEKAENSLFELGNAANEYYQYLDDDSKAKVDEYNNAISSVADRMSREGLKAVSRNTLFNLKRTYASQIVPINNAAKSAANIYDQYRKLSMQDPTLMISNMPSVSDLIEDPNAMPTIVSGNDLYKQGALAATQLPEISYDQLQRYLAGDVTAIPNIDAIEAQIAGAYGVDNLDDSDKAHNYIYQGILGGLSSRAAETQAQQTKLATQLQYDMAKLDAQAQNQAYLDRIRTGNDAYLANLKHTNSMAEIEARGNWSVAAKQAGRSGGSSGSGTSYTTQGSESVYFKGDKTYRSGANKKEYETAHSNSKATPVGSPLDLSTENKVKALNLVGVSANENMSDMELDRLITENMDKLAPYTYYEYNGKRKKDREFERVPNKVVRDTEYGEQSPGVSTEDLLLGYEEETESE